MISTAPSDATSAHRATSDSERFGPPDSPLTGLRRSLAELQEYLSYYVAAQADLVKARVRQVVVLAALALLGGAALVALIVTAAVQLLEGLAGAVAALLEIPLWGGRLIAGPSFLILVAVLFWAVSAGLSSAALRKTREHYAQRQRRQQAIFGRDVAQRAAEHERHAAAN